MGGLESLGLVSPACLCPFLLFTDFPLDPEDPGVLSAGEEAKLPTSQAVSGEGKWQDQTPSPATLPPPCSHLPNSLLPPQGLLASLGSLRDVEEGAGGPALFQHQGWGGGGKEWGWGWGSMNGKQKVSSKETHSQFICVFLFFSCLLGRSLRLKCGPFASTQHHVGAC